MDGWIDSGGGGAWSTSLGLLDFMSLSSPFISHIYQLALNKVNQKHVNLFSLRLFYFSVVGDKGGNSLTSSPFLDAKLASQPASQSVSQSFVTLGCQLR